MELVCWKANEKVHLQFVRIAVIVSIIIHSADLTKQVLLNKWTMQIFRLYPADILASSIKKTSDCVEKIEGREAGLQRRKTTF